LENTHSLKDQSYLLHSDALAIRNFSSPNREGLTIPAGSTVTVVKGPYNGELLLEVFWANECLLIFTDDVKHHATLVIGAPSSVPS
jgi:hypothetical protein